MKRLLIALAVATSLISMASLPALAGTGTTGNGAPSGPHYNLNIIGIEKGGSASGGSDGHTLFVPLSGKTCQINLFEGSFQVLQPNCLNADNTAQFQLPNPDPTNS